MSTRRGIDVEILIDYSEVFFGRGAVDHLVRQYLCLDIRGADEGSVLANFFRILAAVTELLVLRECANEDGEADESLLGFGVAGTVLGVDAK